MGYLESYRQESSSLFGKLARQNNDDELFVSLFNDSNSYAVSFPSVSVAHEYSNEVSQFVLQERNPIHLGRRASC